MFRYLIRKLLKSADPVTTPVVQVRTPLDEPSMPEGPSTHEYPTGNCRCDTPPFVIPYVEEKDIGCAYDTRYGDVSVKPCSECGTLWLEYWFDTNYRRFSVG